MWAEYNHANYPVVEVHMRGVIKDDNEFDEFLDGWMELYRRQRDFVFIFDTREVGWVNPKYALRMARFIRKLKKQDYQYLKRSSIIVNSFWVNALLSVIFAIQSPVCPIDYHSDTTSISVEKLQEIANKQLMRN
jgi:hypothetical protein